MTRRVSSTPRDGLLLLNPDRRTPDSGRVSLRFRQGEVLSSQGQCADADVAGRRCDFDAETRRRGGRRGEATKKKRERARRQRRNVPVAAERPEFQREKHRAVVLRAELRASAPPRLKDGLDRQRNPDTDVADVVINRSGGTTRPLSLEGERLRVPDALRHPRIGAGFHVDAHEAAEFGGTADEPLDVGQALFAGKIEAELRKCRGEWERRNISAGVLRQSACRRRRRAE